MKDGNPGTKSYRDSHMPTRVLFDTSVVRAMVHMDLACLALEELYPADADLSVCLANNAIPELVLMLFEERLPWRQWSARVSAVHRLLDQESPVFSSDDESLLLYFAPPRRTAILRNEHNRAMWQMLATAKCLEDLESGPPFIGSDGVPYQIRTSRELATQLAREHREAWQRTVRDAKGLAVGYHPTQEHIAELQFNAFSGGRNDEAQLRQKNDAYVRSFARFLALALARGNSYNAEGRGRRGDSFDLESLQALGVPALLCTLDQRLRSHVVESGSFQARQLLSPCELVDRTR